jgi:Tfp pilus assembly PilM family ATPase
VLRTVRLPQMSWPERLRTSRFEAQRFAGWDLEEADSIVRLHALDRAAGTFAIGVTRAESVDSRIRAARIAGLRAVAVDHDAFAIRRLFPDCDAIVDVGAERATVHCFSTTGPVSLVAHVGGATITRGIASELSIDIPTAERRKRILGCAGAGIAASEEVVAAIAALIDRARTRVSIEGIAVTGNGARLPNFARALEGATGAVAGMPVPEVLHTAAYPEDVVRVAAPDWALAASLALWEAAA